MADYDSPWKEAVDTLFRPFLAFFFPEVEADIDWGQDHEALEQEMRKLLPAAQTGKRLADRLIKVVTKQGDIRYLHVEVQGEPEDDFAHRMDVYNYRARDRVGQPVISVAVLTDDDPTWRPTAYEFHCWGCEQSLRFPAVKVLDWSAQAAELETHVNPFALFVLAHLRSRQTRHDAQERARVKLALLLRLYERNFEAEELRQWYRLLDWILELPSDLEAAVWEQVSRYEKEKQMPFMTFPERYGMEKGLEKGREQGREQGREEGLLAGIEALLDVKFGTEGLALLPEVRGRADLALLQQLLQTLRTAASLDEVRALLSRVTPTDSNGPTG